jgi:hypothetical protein
MLRPDRILAIGMALLVVAPAWGREACQERTLSLRYAPQPVGARNWCWAASGQMLLELLGEQPTEACQCRQVEEILDVKGCCSERGSCLPAAQVPPRCDEPRWPAFVERPGRFPFDYRTTCDDLPRRHEDDGCRARPLGWYAITAEICKGRPLIAALRPPGSGIGHLVVVKGFSTHPRPRVLVVDSAGLCPPDRDCEGELDEGFWLSYEEYAAGWAGLAHWVDFYGIRKREAETPAPRPSKGHRTGGRR